MTIAALVAGALTACLGIIGAVFGTVLMWFAFLRLAYPPGANVEAVGVLPFVLGWAPGVFWCTVFYIARILLKRRNKKNKDLNPDEG